MTGRLIMHIDMNAFFASVEQQNNPQLRGKPVAVTGRGRTVVTTASYEARALGVRTGMNTWQARQACPEVIFVIGDNRKYTHTSAEIMKMLHDYTPLVETFSIDEAWLDLTGSIAIFGPVETIANQIKARIRERFGITCSIGIAPNKRLAKLASEMQKPDGLTIIEPEAVSSILEHLPVKALCGIGRKMEQQLFLLGIKTCGELGRFPVEILARKFGVTGRQLHDMGRGVDNSPVVPAAEQEEVKSVSHSMTLDRDITAHKDILKYLLQLADMVGRRARRYEVAGKTVHLTVRYADFTTISRQQTGRAHTNQSSEIFREAAAILDTLEMEQPVRLLGVGITNLCYQRLQLPLFDDERRKVLATSAMDEVNDRFGGFKVIYGTVLESDERGSFVISPAWRPEGIRNVEVS